MIDPRTDAQRYADESRERSKRVSALMAKVDAQLRQEVMDVLWAERRNANPWRPSMRPADLQEPYA